MFLYKNNATSRLKLDITSSETVLQVLPGEGERFPSPTGGDYFICTIDDRRSGQVEITHCIARTGDILNVVRAQEGTAAQDFVKDATIANRFTAGTIDAIREETGYSESESDARFVNVEGDTMVGQLLVPAPEGGGSVTNKTYVDDQVATKIGDAPNDGNPYIRKSLTWSLSDWTALVGKPATFPPSPHSHPQSDISGLVSDLAAKEDKLNKGIANGYASLNALGQVPSAQLPSYVDDVQEYPTLFLFPATGEAGIIYVALDTNKTYRWSGTLYTEISPSPGTTDNVPEGSVNLYFTTFRASAAAPVQTVAGQIGNVVLSKSDVGLANVDNTSDLAKPVSTATQTALNLKLNDAPTDGGKYVRQSAVWTAITIPPATVMQDTPPVSPVAGQLWYETDSGDTFIWFDDGSSSQWVQVNVTADDSTLYVAKAGDTMTGKLTTAASAAGSAGFSLPHGAAPTSPVNGDVWSTTSNFFYRLNGTTYSAAFLNGSSTFTGTKTFSVPPIMATPTTAQASVRLPAGVAPTAPTDGDLWGTTTGLFARVNGVTYNLTNTFPEAPVDGQQYARQNAAWAAVTIPPGTIMSDTAPPSPANGQMWWETDTGRLFIYYNDGNTSQWVQINAPMETVTPPAQTAETENRIINGNFAISQENGQTAGGTSSYYFVDQWLSSHALSGAVVSYSQIDYAPPVMSAKGSYVGRFQVTTLDTSLAAGDYAGIFTVVEGLNFHDLLWGNNQGFAGSPAVLRFSIMAITVAGLTFNVMIKNAASDTTFVQTFSVPTTGVYHDITIPIPAPPAGTVWPTDNTRCMMIGIVFACGTTYAAPATGWNSGNYIGATGMSNGLAAINDIRIANVGIYKDPNGTGIAPPFVHPDYATELEKCRRYYQDGIYLIQSIPTNSGSSYYGTAPYAPAMRILPTVTGVNSSASSFPATVGTISVQINSIRENRVASATANTGLFATNFVANARM